MGEGFFARMKKYCDSLSFGMMSVRVTGRCKICSFFSVIIEICQIVHDNNNNLHFATHLK